MVRVWFNHWFSSAYDLIELLKQDNPELYVIGSSTTADSVVKLACDEWHQEPAEVEGYIDFCIDFCRKNRIDVFFPRKNLELVSKFKDRFTDLGVKVLIDDYPVVSLLNDKAKTYGFLKDIKGLNIPEYHIVNNAREFEEAYEKISEKGGFACVKFVRDEGAMSYRRIVKGKKGFDRLRTYPGVEMLYDDYLACLSEKESFDDLMVMEYLPGREISVDCLATEQGPIIIPRFKSFGRAEQVDFDPSIVSLCESILDRTKLECPCNVQFKEKDGIPYLLEINTRMSGGLQMSCLAAEINIPRIAYNKLIGKKERWSMKKIRTTLSFVEAPKIL